MENNDRLQEKLKEVGILYLTITGKLEQGSIVSGKYIDSKNPERNFTFENAHIIEL